MSYYYIKSLEKILSISMNRKLILYQIDLLSEIVYKNLLHMGKDIEYFISDNMDVSYSFNKEVRNIYDLLYEDKKDIYVLVFALTGHAHAYEVLINMGLEFEKDFCIHNIGGYYRKFDAVDSLLGFNRKYKNMWGFEVYGDSNTANIKIMILGGSTSDPTMGNYKSWPEFLYERAAEKYNVAVYSGGLAGYGVAQEFLKFVRDGLILKPDILITYDGYNDAGFNVSIEEHPYLHRYQYKFYNYIQERRPMAPDSLAMRSLNTITHGLKSDLTDSENWISNIRKIHAVATEFEIHHYSFFQPMILSGKAIIDESIFLLQEQYFNQAEHYKEAYNKVSEFAIKCKKEIINYSYITDLTNIFDGEEDVYYDLCHSTDKGSNIIAKCIYSKIENVLEELTK